jgi:hypothetical protein
MAQGNTPTMASSKSESGVAIVRSFYEALAKGDLQAITGPFGPRGRMASTRVSAMGRDVP